MSHYCSSQTSYDAMLHWEVSKSRASGQTIEQMDIQESYMTELDWVPNINDQMITLPFHFRLSYPRCKMFPQLGDSLYTPKPGTMKIRTRKFAIPFLLAICSKQQKEVLQIRQIVFFSLINDSMHLALSLTAPKWQRLARMRHEKS